MTKPTYHSAVASIDRRPPAHGFESHSPHPDRAASVAILPNDANGPAADGRLDHFVQRDGIAFAGTHLIVDLWHASNLDDLHAIEQGLRDAADGAGATLLKVDIHHFSTNGGVSALAALAESHITIHTWPELSYAAVDVFMCGKSQPYKAIDVLKGVFLPGLVTLAEHKRGVIL